MLKKTLTLGLFALLLSASAAMAQEARIETIEIPLSDPSQPLSLKASSIHGGIQVRSHNRSNVIVRVVDRRAEEPMTKRSDGMMRIPNRSTGVRAAESRNEIVIETDPRTKGVDLEIMVPRQSSLWLKCINSCELVVTDVEGDLELSNTNGGITATGVHGSVVANTTNGDVKVEFARFKNDEAMSFASFNGDVDITFPAGLNADVKVSSKRGDVFTDFEMDVERAAPKLIREQDDRGTRIQSDEFIRGKIGRGGADLHFKTFQGDVYIRKSK